MKQQQSALNSLGCRMYVEDDLRPWRCPLQVAPHSYPQLVDVCMLAVIRRDGQRVRDRQQLNQTIGEWRSPVGESKVLLWFFHIRLDKKTAEGKSANSSEKLRYLLWSVVLWDQPVELRGCRKLHALKLPEQTHGHGLRRVGLEEGRRAGNAAKENRYPLHTINFEVKLKKRISER